MVSSGGHPADMGRTPGRDRSGVRRCSRRGRGCSIPRVADCRRGTGSATRGWAWPPSRPA